MATRAGQQVPVPPKTEGTADSNFWKAVKYLYFIRFSLMLWLFFPLLAVLDGTKLSAMTRGIVALESKWDVFFASFFVTVAGWVALLAARITCAYGKERFGSEPPPQFSIEREMSVRAFWGAQVPGFILLGYVWFITLAEQGDRQVLSPLTIGTLMLGGVALALVCWILMARIYYWMFWRPNAAFRDDAKAFVIPYAERFKKLEEERPSAALLALLHLFEHAACLGDGYRDKKRGDFELHSGHAFAFLTLAFLAAIYVAFWDFTAPVELVKVRLFEIIFFLTGAAIWTLLTLRRLRSSEEPGKPMNVLRMAALFLPLLVVVSLPFWSKNRPEVMPVLGFVTVLLMFVFWGLGGLAFLLDRFRVPVLTLLGLIFLGLNAVLPDHYLSSTELPKNVRLSTPDKILARFESAAGGEHAGHAAPRPVIIVTATGGGIHAAAWTAAVLANFEATFDGKAPQAGLFHNSIVLMSTVSGGSVGTVPWLTQYTSGGSFTGRTAQGIAECSDLRAVAWGLSYADFLRAIYPFRFSKLGKTLNTYDRGWALEQAFWRNRQTKCLDSSQFDAKVTEPLLSSLAGTQRYVPAFSLNTTVEETGSRFLSANYQLPTGAQNSEITPADSFLVKLKRDITLSTAARLSANFPYVSPMPRLEPPALSFHFGDGGYFDNDGTASAMEFLWYSLKDRPAGAPVIPVLLLEIRDGSDPSGAGDANPKESDWGPLKQGLGPLTTFYNANHVSVTRRNRRELCFMEQALHSKATFTHIVVPYTCQQGEQCSESAQPLSWHLTGKQKQDIDHALQNREASASMTAGWTWFEKAGKPAQEPAKSQVTRDGQEEKPIGCEKGVPL